MSFCCWPVSRRPRCGQPCTSTSTATGRPRSALAAPASAAVAAPRTKAARLLSMKHTLCFDHKFKIRVLGFARCKKLGAALHPPLQIARSSNVPYHVSVPARGQPRACITSMPTGFVYVAATAAIVVTCWAAEAVSVPPAANCTIDQRVLTSCSDGLTVTTAQCSSVVSEIAAGALDGAPSVSRVYVPSKCEVGVRHDC